MRECDGNGRDPRGPCTGFFGVALLCALLGSPSGEGTGFVAGFETIEREDLEAHLEQLAGPELEGRDSPSLGLDLAAAYLAERFAEAGLTPLGEEGYLLPFERWMQRPVASSCALQLLGDPGTTLSFGDDFVPLGHFAGEASGELVFAGFGIDARAERYEELRGDLGGAVVMILDGEPNHGRRFDGPEVTRHANLWTKLEHLAEAGVAGAIVVRRNASTGPLGFRHTWASWSTERMTDVPGGLPRERIPVIEVTLSCATSLLGDDVPQRALELDRTAKARRPDHTGRQVSFVSASELGDVPISNVAGLLRGSDPDLAAEFVVVGAHYDHVGVDDRGRIGFGADDNASGIAALLEVMEAMVTAQPRRSLVFCAFAAEEDGLLGSQAFCRSSALELSQVVGMINMDMLARGKTREVAVLGVKRNPKLAKVLDRAKKLRRTGVEKMVLRRGEELWQRSDHYPFHQRGVPTLFFFEGLPISRNPDYHTWRDTVDRLDFDKLTRTTRLVFNTAWLLADDDERPPAPRD